jgi:hypothetical protein
LWRLRNWGLSFCIIPVFVRKDLIRVDCILFSLRLRLTVLHIFVFCLQVRNCIWFLRSFLNFFLEVFTIFIKAFFIVALLFGRRGRWSYIAFFRWLGFNFSDLARRGLNFFNFLIEFFLVIRFWNFFTNFRKVALILWLTLLDLLQLLIVVAFFHRLFWDVFLWTAHIFDLLVYFLVIIVDIFRFFGFLVFGASH